MVSAPECACTFERDCFQMLLWHCFYFDKAKPQVWILRVSSVRRLGEESGV